MSQRGSRSANFLGHLNNYGVRRSLFGKGGKDELLDLFYSLKENNWAVNKLSSQLKYYKEKLGLSSNTNKEKIDKKVIELEGRIKLIMKSNLVLQKRMNELGGLAKANQKLRILKRKIEKQKRINSNRK